jgi:hypothetical protein
VIQSKQIKPIKIKGLLCIAVVLFSFCFYWFDVFTLYRCCVVSPFVFIGLMCLLGITVVLLVPHQTNKNKRKTTQQRYKVNTSNQ